MPGEIPRNLITMLILLASITGCRTGRGVVTPVQRDSIRIEYREIYRERIDTAWVDVPVEVVRIVTRDTVSRIAGRYAVTTAEVHGGLLHHTLLPTGAQLPVQTVTVEHVRDSIVYRDREVPVEVEHPVEERRTPRAVRWMAVGFWLLLAAAAVRYRAWIIRLIGVVFPG